MNYKEFSNNSLVVDFIEKEVKAHFPEKYVPEWINYDTFKAYMIEKATIDLYKNIDSNFWWDSLLIPFPSYKLDTSSSSFLCFLEEYDRYSPKVPDNIKSLLE
jgi:hypothetical protein